MKISEAVDVMNNATSNKVLLDVAFDRLRNNFYGYLLTSLVFFNLENIVLVFKSKNSIEMTLIYIGLQKDFVWNFFWVPIFYGMLASIVMPVITAIYALITGLVKAIRDDSNPLGIEILAAIKITMRSYRDKAEKKKEALANEIEVLVYRRDFEKRLMSSEKSQKEEFVRYIEALVNVYGVYNNNNSERDLVGFLDEINRANIIQYFPNPKLLNEMIQFVHENSKN